MNDAIVYLIDDDIKLRTVLSEILDRFSLKSIGFDSAEAFLAFRHEHPLSGIGCIVLDIRMGKMSGLELQQVLSEQGCKLPIIFLTGHANVKVVVQTVKQGAFDFLEKPFDNSKLVELVHAALELSRKTHDHEQRLVELSERERDVFDLLVLGKTNKRIAEELTISISTTEFHRANIMRKLSVNSLEALIALN